MTKSGKLRVLLDAANMRPGGSGISTVTRGLAGALAAREDIDLFVVSSDAASMSHIPARDIRSLGPMCHSYVGRAMWREAALPRIVREWRCDVVFVNTPELPYRSLPVPSAVIVHDAGALVAPAVYGTAKWVRYRADLPRVCRAASRLLCVSGVTQLDLFRTVGVDPAKTTVVHPAVDPDLRDVVRAPASPPFVLYVGTQQPQKNVSTLLRAWARLEGDPPVSLVLAGPVSPSERAGLDAAARDLGIAPLVEHRGFVSREELLDLYARAAAVVMPSLYEGFGLPILEALTVGVPVVASGLPVFREVSGGRVSFVDDPLDADEWARRIGDAVRRGSAEAPGGGPGREPRSWKEAGDACAQALWGLMGT